MSQVSRLTWLCYGGMMALSIGLNLLPVFLTQLSNTFGGKSGLSGEQLGRLGSIAFLGLVVGILVAGAFSEKLKSKFFAQLGNLLTIVGLLLMALSPSYEILCGALLITGIGAGTLDMVLSPVVSDLHPNDRTRAMNYLHSFYCVGAVATILVGMIAVQTGLSWRIATAFASILPLLLIFGFAPMKFPDQETPTVTPCDPTAPSTPLGELLKNKWFVAALLAIFLGGATELGMAQWLPAYVETSLQFPRWIGAASLLAFSLAMALGRMVVGLLGRRFSAFDIMATGCLLSVFLFLLGSFSPNPFVALVSCTLVGFTGSALWPTMLAVTANQFPQGGSPMFAALACLGNAGGIFMPWAVGWISDRSNLHCGLAISALAPAFMILVVLRLKAVDSPTLP